MGIRTVEYLLPVGTGRGDAQCPRRAWTEGAALCRTLRKVGFVTDCGGRVRVVRHVDLDDVEELAVAIEHLDAPVGAVGRIDVALGVGGDRVNGSELAGFGTLGAPLFNPVAVLVDLGHTRIDVAIADIGVAFRIPGDVGGLTETAIGGRERRIGPMQRMGVLVRGFRFAAEHHHDAAVLVVELDDHVRALVGGPDIVVLIDPHRVGERPCIEVLADLPNEVTLRRKFEQLRSRVAIGRTKTGAATGIDKDVAFRIDRHAGGFAKVHVGRHLEEVRNGFVRDLRNGILRPGRHCHRRNQRH